jgi:hypothetical protein
MRVAGNTSGSLECGAMPTRIVFVGAETLLVSEELDDVVKGLEDISPNSADTVRLTRTVAHADPGTVEGLPVHVRPSHVLYVTPA